MANSEKYVIQGIGLNVIERGIYASGVRVVQSKANPAGRDLPLYKSALGTPVYGDFYVQPFNYNSDGVTYVVPGVKLYTVVIEVTKTKNIVTTPIQGLPGTVKEYISDGDDVIVLTGSITSENGIYPYNEVSDLKKLIAAPVAFKAVSRWLQNLDIDTLVITGAEIPQMEGQYSYQDFKIYCISDIPVELNLISSSNTTAQ